MNGTEHEPGYRGGLRAREGPPAVGVDQHHVGADVDDRRSEIVHLETGPTREHVDGLDGHRERAARGPVFALQGLDPGIDALGGEPQPAAQLDT